MIGIDITRISRFENKNDKFVTKTLHEEEVKEFNESKNKPLFLATRWAIKEALFKADNSLFTFRDIRIEKIDRVYKYPGYVITTSKEDDYLVVQVAKRRNDE